MRVIFGALLLAIAVGPLTARPTVAVVLEGGGALGLAHVGVIRAMEQVGIPVDIVVGTSMGAIVGGFWSLGYDAKALERIARTTPWMVLFDEKPPIAVLSAQDRLRQGRSLLEVGFDEHGLKTAGGLLSGKKIVAYIDQIAAEASAPQDFDQFPRRFRAVASDVSSGERVEISHGRLADALRASMGIPGFFSPYLYQGRYLVDGGVVSNLPVATAKALGADLVIAVHLVVANSLQPEDYSRNPTAALSRSLDILINHSVREELALADLELDVNLENVQASDFSRADEIIDRGMAAGDRIKPQLTAFLAKLGSPAVEPLPVPQGPKIAKIEIVGATTSDQGFIRQAFAPVLGQPAGTKTLMAPYLDLFDHTDYAWVRFVTSTEPEGTTLRIEATPAPLRDSTFQLGVQYQVTYSNVVMGQGALTPGVTLRGLTGPGSRFSVDAQVPDTPGIALEYEQPFSWNTFGAISYQAQHESETYFVQSSLAYQYQTSFQRVGMDFGVAPVPGLEVRTGLRRDWIGNSDWPGISREVQVSTTTAGVASLHYENTDSTVLPTRGLEFSGRYLNSLTTLGSQRAFQTVESNGSVTIPVVDFYSVSVLWRMGTDLSGGTASSDSAPPLNRPTLSDRRLFPGPFYLEDQMGNTVWALGIEGKHRWSIAAGTFGVSIYTLLQAALGVASQAAWDQTPGLLTSDSTFNASMGVGMRLSEGEGLALRAGLIRQARGGTLPFLSLDLGSRVF